MYILIYFSNFSNNNKRLKNYHGRYYIFVLFKLFETQMFRLDNRDNKIG